MELNKKYLVLLFTSVLALPFLLEVEFLEEVQALDTGLL
jgi:hypothetical protein